MHVLAPLATAALLAVSLAPTRADAPPETEPAVHEVRMTMHGDVARFEPATITAAPGDRVRFVTVEGGPHNVAFAADSIPAAAAAALGRGMPETMAPLTGPFVTEAGASYVVSLDGVPAGRYPFSCLPHVAMGMKGVLVVR